MSVRTVIEKSWQQPNLLSYLLWPLSVVYRGLFWLRKYLFDNGVLARYEAPLPVIVVGNLTVGGTGKTPLVIYLIDTLRAAGFTPGVISRGYGGDAPAYPLMVLADTPVSHSGDEPALIVKRTNVPMAVGANRKQSIETLLALHQIDVIISDDGLQHLALERDIELCLLDATNTQRNSYLLPAGPFRESLARLKSVDFIVEHGLEGDTLKDGDCHYAMNLSPKPPRPLAIGGEGRDETFAADKPFHALAGIGNPSRFFTTCRQLGYRFTEHVFDDHHAFEQKDIDFGAAQVLMTEKDAVKCVKFADSRHWYLPVDAKLSREFATKLVDRLKALSANL